MRLPSKTTERKLFRSGFKRIIGVDEVGMGCLAGPVVVCAVAFRNDFYRATHRTLHWLRDSKLLTSAQRGQFVAELLKKKNFQARIGYCYPRTIDRMNIYQAARLAMRRAVKRLANREAGMRNNGSKNSNSLFQIPNSKIMVLVDGPHPIPGLDVKQMPIVKGDRKVFAIACASILAKVFRDRMMTRYAKKYPGYGFDQHKGYGTQLHRARLAALGPCEIHRRSFSPVADLL